jgi:T5SS/PEP-CTERM-associated repeat protein
MTYPALHSRFALGPVLLFGLLALAAWPVAVFSPLRAQVVPDGASVTLANITNTITGSVTVGTNGAFTLLTLSDNALLTNSAHGVIGRNATAKSNEVQLLSASARWLMSGSLFVGSNGALSTLLVSNGATVVAGGSGTLGHGGDFSGNANSNTVTVAGAGSLWSIGLELVVGELGFANRLNVSSGGRVSSSNAFVGRSFFSPSNVVMVTDAGSVWNSRADLSVGGASAGNLLVVSNGGWVVSSNAYLGNGLGAGNVALVTGLNSSWSNRADLFVGNGARANRLVVNDGALVVNNNGVLGNSVTSSNNLALVTGAGSLWSNRAGLVIGALAGNNLMVVSNGATVYAILGELGSTAASGTNEVVVTGTGSAWRTEEGVLIGRNSAGNRLRIANGGKVNSGTGFIGHSAANNEAVLTGPGAAWTNQLDCYVGFFSSGNRLTISNGAALHASDSSYLGYNAGDGNTATITGPGSVWRSAGRFIVGDFGRSNLIVANAGATLIAGGHGALGVTSGSSNNSMIVAQPGTSLMVGGDFFVGSNGAFNVMQLATGASASIGGRTYVGSGTNGNNNTLDVSNAGSVWTSQDFFMIGGGGPGRNLLLVRNGGVARGFSDGYVGLGGPLNEVIIRDPGSLWDLPLGTLSVGVYDGGNLMTVRDGGVARSALGELGRFTFSSNALVTVTGTGSLWQITGALSVGASGSRHRLVIDSGGAVVTSSGVFVGAQLTSIQNQVTVSGGVLQATNPSLSAVLDVRRGTNVLNAGLIDVDRLLLTNAQGFFQFNGGTLVTRGGVISNGVNFVVGGSGSSPATWDVRAGPTSTFVSPNIFVGSNSAFNRIVVTNGAQMTNASVVIVGYTAGGNSNLVLLSGAGTRWSTPSVLEVGVAGASGNRLVISNGAGMTSHFNNSIGWSGSSNNEVMVTGLGSFWDRRNSSGMLIFCGNGGQNNRLIVTNGGLVASSYGYIGTLAVPCSNNFAVVTGTGSTWSNLFEILVGEGGSASRLLVEDGGLVTAGLSCYVGFSPGSINNRIIINNATLRVTNATADGLLEIRRGTNVLTAGLIEADILRLTNGALGRIEVNGGTLAIRSSRVSIGNPVIIGNGVSPATLHLAGNGTHDMSGTLGLIITNNATLSGNGSLLVQLQVRPGATLSPGASIGKISVNTAPFLSGTTLMEISKSGTALTNDQFAVTGTLTYGGTLTVTHLGPTALAAGDRFPLFNATSYAGAFASLSLPPLPAPLFWKNNLLTDGSIAVAAPPAIALSSGSYTQGFDSLSLSGGTNPWRDNSTLLGWYAAKSVAPTNITTYIASDGNGNAGALYSFGSSGSGERALGSIGSGSVDTISYGLGFTNDTGVSVSNFLVSYTGEQWRDSSSFNTNTLTFWYRLSPFALTNPEPGVVTNWTAHTALDFASPTVTGAGLGINGNTPANRRVFASVPVPGLIVPPGHCVFFRWQDPDDPGTDEGIAVDDLTVTFLPSARDFGVDVSHFQNESGVPQSSWDQMFAEGKRFAFIKATEGLTGPHDPTMSNNVARATAAGLLAGVYHFAHPENRPTTNGAVLEASNFVVYAGSAIGPGRLRPVLDLERGANLTTTELTDWVIAFCNEIIARRGPGAAPIIYCSQTFANNELDSRLAGYDLWLRTVNSGADPAVDQPPAQLGFSTATGVFTNWSFWQYSSTGNSGGLSPLDLNVCHSEYKPLSSFLITNQIPSAIQLTGMTASQGGAFAIHFTNTPGAVFTVLTSPDPGLPLVDWIVLGTVTEVAPGQFQFADVQATNHLRRFYVIRSP